MLARAGFLLQDTALVAIAVLAVRRAVSRRSSTAFGALLLCATPLVLFQAGTLAPNGTEIVAVVAFLAALLAALRARSRGWWWAAAGVGAFACWTRDLGAIEVVLFGLLAALVVPGARWLVDRLRSTDVIAAVVVALAALGSTIWQVVLKSSLHVGLESPGTLLADLGRTVELLRESIGLLGWLNIPIDPFVEALWIAGWVDGRRRARPPGRSADRGSPPDSSPWRTSSATSSCSTPCARPGSAAKARFTIALPIAAVVILVVGQPAGRAALVRSRVGQWPLAVASVVAAAGQPVRAAADRAAQRDRARRADELRPPGLVAPGWLER